jgi:hypothetical protein
VTVNVEVPVFPALSRALQVTVLVPTGKMEPEGGAQVTAGEGGPTMSVAVGLV